MNEEQPVPRRGAAALLGATLLAGCANTPLTAPPPPVATPAAWQAPLPAGATHPAGADWWARFNEPVLPPLIAATQAASPTLASATARIEQARAARAAAGAALLPGVSAVGSASHGRSQLGTPVATSASLGVQAGWELDLFGANAAGRDAAQARLEAAQAGWHDARISLAAETASSLLAYRACEAQLLQSRRDAESREQTARLTDASARAGFTAPADAALARAGAAQARSQAVNQRAACETLLKSLVELSDTPEPELRQRLAAGSARVPAPEPIAVGGVPAQVLAQRPDLIEAGRQLLAAAADRDQRRAQQLPQISFSGQLAAASLRSQGVTQSGSVWSVGPLSVSLPLFDGGARSAATAAAQAAYDEALAQYQARVRRALREVEAALVALQATAERETDATQAAQDYEASLRATEQRQKGGLASLFDLENARRNAVQAQSALIDLQRERAAAWISLYRALGGGWSQASLAAAGQP
jgi:NodT family efflux transporter outer membrane factor (OMF) lipoprotein